MSWKTWVTACSFAAVSGVAVGAVHEAATRQRTDQPASSALPAPVESTISLATSLSARSGLSAGTSPARASRAASDVQVMPPKPAKATPAKKRAAPKKAKHPTGSKPASGKKPKK